MECKFCKQTFKSVYSLKIHIKSAKYCLKIQKDVEYKNEIQEKYQCVYCSKISTTKQSLELHYNTCKKYHQFKLDNEIKNYEETIKTKDNIITELKDENEDLKYRIKDLEIELEIIRLKTENEIFKKDSDQLKALASQPKTTTTTNNRILNMNQLNLDSGKIKNILENRFTIDDISDGQKGLANFAINNFLKDEEGKLNYVCTDPSRQIFRYKDSLGDIQKDVKAKKLTNLLVESGIKQTVQKVSETSWTKDDGSQDSERLFQILPSATELNSIDKNNSIFATELSSMTTI